MTYLITMKMPTIISRRMRSGKRIVCSAAIAMAT